VRVGIMAMMLVIMFAIGFYILPRINAIQEAVGGPVNMLLDTDARRAEFDRLHGLSTILFSITAIGGLALCWWEARE
jgi:type II secretory pathway component PulF